RLLKDIYQEIEQSFLDNRERLIQFFQKHGFNEAEAKKLTNALKSAVFFLETNKYDRDYLEQDMRKEMRTSLNEKIQELTNLKTNSASLKELAPQLNWDIVFESRIQELQKHMVFKTRAGQNKSLEMALEPLFWRLRDFGKGQAEQVRLVYYLFVEFGLDDYGKDIDKYDSPDGKLSEVEVIQHERIRKQFQQPAIKSRDQYAEIFGWDA
ncbi:uncharacterized protein METZ01_LOCUS328575, partial [marine metagenome]